MKKETFDQAKFLREKISHLRVKQLQLEQMKERKDDTEFNLARELASDSIHYVMTRLENDFNSL